VVVETLYDYNNNYINYQQVADHRSK